MARNAGNIPGATKVNFARGRRGAQLVRNFRQAKIDVKNGFLPARGSAGATPY